jgi:hypothetical protein
MDLSKKHKSTLKAIFTKPTLSTIRWHEVSALIIALGGTVEASGKTGGSRQRMRLKGRRAVIHKPHPSSEIVKGSVESIRYFLKNAGIEPKEE